MLGLIAADISLGVIHDRANRPNLARQSEVVNNSAAGENSSKIHISFALVLEGSKGFDELPSEGSIKLQCAGFTLEPAEALTWQAKQPLPLAKVWTVTFEHPHAMG